MSNVDVIRAWKDEAYRMSLSEAERAALPANPAGLIELDEADLDAVAGGLRPINFTRTIVVTRSRCGGGNGGGTGGGGGTGTGTGGNCTKCKPACG